MSQIVSNQERPSYTNRLVSFGTAIFNPLASLAAGLITSGSHYGNRNQRVEIKLPVEQLQNKEPQPEIVLPQPELEISPPSTKVAGKRKRETKPVIEEPFESKESSKVLKTRARRTPSVPSLKCAGTSAKRRLAKARSVTKIDAGALQKTLQKDRIATLLSKNLGIDLERANSHELQNIQELSQLAATLQKSSHEFKRKNSKEENQYVSQTETGLARDLKFRADGSIFILDKVLGQGTFKKVMRAVDAQTLQVYASSEFLIDNEETRAEIQFIRKFKEDDSGLVKTYAIDAYTDENGETRTTLLQKLYGAKLTDLIEEKTLIKKAKIQIAADTATSLMKIHSQNLCHLDLKPDNLLTYFDEKGNRRAVLADYDQTCLIDTQISSSGTEGFKAPELEEGVAVPSSPKMDIYSFGVTLRSHLFRGRGLSTLAKETQSIVNRMIDADPKNRASIEEVLAAFQKELS